jgi:hypothetical protein
VGLKDTLFPVFRMPGNKNKFDPVQQPDIGKLFFRLFPPVPALINGDTVDPVKKGPAVRADGIGLVHADGSCYGLIGAAIVVYVYTMRILIRSNFHDSGSVINLLAGRHGDRAANKKSVAHGLIYFSIIP